MGNRVKARGDREMGKGERGRKRWMKKEKGSKNKRT